MNQKLDSDYSQNSDSCQKVYLPPSVSSRPPKTGGGIAMFRGEGVWGRSKGVPLPNGDLGGFAPRKIFEIWQQILAKYSTFFTNYVC